VLIENGGFGGSTAGPIARKVLDTYLLADAPAEPKKNSAELGSAAGAH
jgi:penicillin-binding protein 2